MEYIYETDGVCSTHIKFDINDDVISNIEFFGGCNGNLKAVASLCDGMTVDEIAQKCGGITCGRRPTSCSDQFVKAVRAAQEEARKDA